MHSSAIKQENSQELILREVFSKFQTSGDFRKGYSFGTGHIHDTYLVETDGPDNYILQRLNNRVFRKIPELQENIERVTIHIRKKLHTRPGADPKRECLTLIHAECGKTWITDLSGSFWRMYVYIPNHRSYDIVDSPDKAFEGGKAIGRFQAMLADMGGEPLHETIPWFHDIERRLDTFNSKIKADPEGRVNSASDEIREYLARAKEMNIILSLGREGRIPLRITHNDTKFNNILLDENDRALCVIDLDTVMPGYVHYDFGDAIRTGASSSAEDEPDLSKVSMDIRLFRAYSEGYLLETRDILNTVEKEYLAFAPRLITYTIGLRFLTDYIDGDHYFRIHHDQHNLQRARTQLQLIRSMEKQYLQMQKIISSLS